MLTGVALELCKVLALVVCLVVPSCAGGKHGLAEVGAGLRDNVRDDATVAVGVVHVQRDGLTVQQGAAVVACLATVVLAGLRAVDGHDADAGRRRRACGRVVITAGKRVAVRHARDACARDDLLDVGRGWGGRARAHDVGHRVQRGGRGGLGVRRRRVGGRARREARAHFGGGARRGGAGLREEMVEPSVPVAPTDSCAAELGMSEAERCSARAGCRRWHGVAHEGPRGRRPRPMQVTFARGRGDAA